MNQKKIGFSYMVSCFLNWYQERNNIEIIDDCYSAFSKLSLLKLLFLASAIKVDANGSESDLLDIFQNFTALPYGPVESDVYNSIIDNSIPIYTIGDRTIWIKEKACLTIDDSLKKRIEHSIEALKKENPDLINKNAFQLVEITHKWKSWSEAYSFAEFISQRGYPMKVEEIKNDPTKCFS